MIWANQDALEPAPRPAPAAVRVACLLGIAIAVAALAWVGARSVLHGWPDFEYFYKAGAVLVERGGLDPGYDVSPVGRVIMRGSLDWYLPFVPRLMTLLALLPPRVAGLIWLGLNLLALLAVLCLVGRHLVALPPGDWPVTQLVPFLALLLFWWWEFRLNQINVLTLLLLVGSLICWERGQRVAGGLWLGLAVLLKVTPALLLVWFALKRQHRVVAAALATCLVFGPLGDAVIFGPGDAAAHYRAWFETAVLRGSHRNLIMSQVEMDWRNQGLGAVTSRWLHPTNYATRFDNDPRLVGEAEPRTMNIAALERPTVAGLVVVVHLLSLAALLWVARRPAARLTPARWRVEWALFVLAMLWFMPVLRAYHLIWTYPALAILAAALHYHGRRHWWSLAALAALAWTVAVQVVSLVPGDTPPLPWLWPQAAGVILSAVLILGLPLVLLLRRRNTSRGELVS
jgi:hypothetical protein